jgi:hypothetical protein
MAQEKFSGKTVASSLNALAEHGWKDNIIVAWCPWTEDLWEEYLEAFNGKGKYATKEMQDRVRRFRKRTIHGTIGLIRPIWQQIRKEWMKQQELKRERDPIFFDKIIRYLESL